MSHSDIQEICYKNLKYQCAIFMENFKIHMFNIHKLYNKYLVGYAYYILNRKYWLSMSMTFLS